MRRSRLAFGFVPLTLAIATFAQSGGAGGQPGQVQYNQSGNLAGAGALTYDDSADETTAKILNKTRSLHAYATSGDGSAGNPWSLSSTNWTNVFLGGVRVTAAKGYYNLPSNGVVELPSGTRLVCEPGALLQWPTSVSAGATAMFHIPSGATGVVVRDCEFQPGVTVPLTGEPGGLGQFFIQIGEVDAVSQASFSLENNTFGPARFNSNLAGRQIRIESGTRDSKIVNNKFNFAPRVIDVSNGSTGVQYVHEGLVIRDNLFAFDGAVNDFQYAVSVGYVNTSAVPARFDTLVLQGNTFRNTHSALYVGFHGRALSVLGNTVNSTQADLVFNSDPGNGYSLQDVNVVGNTCFNNDSTVHEDDCVIHVVRGNDVVISSNTLTSHESGVQIDFSNRVIISNNVVNGQGHSGLTCFGVSNSKKVLVTGNQAIDCNPGIGLFGVDEDVAILGNVFVQSAYSVMQYGIAGVSGCTRCTAANNFTQGANLGTNWADYPSAFAWAMANFSTTVPAVQGFSVGAQSISVTNGSHTATLAIGTAATADTTLTLPPNNGSWGQQLTTDGAGVLSWADRSFRADDRLIDSFSTSNSGAYTNGNLANDRDPITFANKTAAPGTFDHDWVFSQASVKSGVLEVWHRLKNTNCGNDPNHIASQTIYYSTNGGTPTTALANSAIVPDSGTTWTVSYVDLPNQDLSQLRVRASFNPNGASGTGFQCRAQVSIIVFNESPNTISFAGQPRTLVLEGRDSKKVLVLTGGTPSSSSSPDLVFRDAQSPVQEISMRKQSDKLAFIGNSGSELMSVDQSSVLRVNGQSVVRGTASNSYGAALWGAANSSGDTVCSNLGLTCVATFAVGSSQSTNCNQTLQVYFQAFCK